MDSIKAAVNQINLPVKEVSAVANHQAQVLMEVTPAVDELANLTEKILQMARDPTSDVDLKTQ